MLLFTGDDFQHPKHPRLTGQTNRDQRVGQLRDILRTLKKFLEVSLLLAEMGNKSAGRGPGAIERDLA